MATFAGPGGVGDPPVLGCCLSSLSSVGLNEERREWRRSNPSCLEPPKDIAGIGHSPEVSSLCSKKREEISNFHVSPKEWWRGGLGFEFQVKTEDMDTGKFCCSGDFRIPSLLVVFPSGLNFLPPAVQRDFQSPATIFPRVFNAAALDTPFHSSARCHIFLGVESKPLANQNWEISGSSCPINGKFKGVGIIIR